MTGLGYVGVDLVLDRTKGPLMLELNARPGLNIQIANRTGLAARLDAVDRADAGRLPAAGLHCICEGKFQAWSASSLKLRPERSRRFCCVCHSAM